MLVTGDSAFILLVLTEETPGTFQDGKTHEINEGSYEWRRHVAIQANSGRLVTSGVLKGTFSCTFSNNDVENGYLDMSVMYLCKRMAVCS